MSEYDESTHTQIAVFDKDNVPKNIRNHPKRLLIATPIFNSNIACGYFTSFIASLQLLISDGWLFGIFTEARGNVSQARNRAAEFAIKNGYTKILFIDADIAWGPEHLIRLLRSNKKVVGGTYPFKTFPIRLNVVPMTGTGLCDLNEYVLKKQDDYGEVEVYRIPTGFLKVDVDIFHKIAPLTETYHHRDPVLNIREDERNFFPAKVGEDGALFSEDWGFCDLVQKAGEKCYFNAHCLVDHLGMHRFSAVTPADEQYAKHRDIIDESDVTDNPFSHWPVNWPCFCGSGDKFKKCCKDPSDIKVPKKDAMILKKDYDKQLFHVKEQMDMGVWYKSRDSVSVELQKSKNQEKHQPGALE